MIKFKKIIGSRKVHLSEWRASAPLKQRKGARKMRQAIDITGVRSGRLTAIEKTDQKRKGSILWRCRCDCGKEILAEAGEISRGTRTSCGCARKGRGAKDVTGQRFGRLTALYRLDRKSGSSYLWHCRCDCGKETDVRVSALLSGNTTSCGCAASDRQKSKEKDLTGQRFGRLTALYRLDRKQGNSCLWHCRCDCGQEIDAQAALLLRGDTTSCGCARRGHGVRDITGRRFGRLTALYRLKTEDSAHAMWHCQCDCGRETDVRLSSLMSGATTSCGCKRGEHEPPALHYVDGTCIERIDHPALYANNTSGYTGVIPLKDGRWRAEITFRGKRQYLGVFSDIHLAAEARKKAENRVFGEFLEDYYAEAEAETTDAAIDTAG